MMPRQKKESKNLNIKLALKISDQLDQFCKESGQSKTTAVERILGHYFDEYFSKPKDDRILI